MPNPWLDIPLEDYEGHMSLPAIGQAQINNIALALFSFPSLASYEEYRAKSLQDPECQAAFRYAEDTRCIISYERSFFRPVLQAAG